MRATLVVAFALVLWVSWLDRNAPRKRALRYWLEDVDVSGARGWHGPIVAS